MEGKGKKVAKQKATKSSSKGGVTELKIFLNQWPRQGREENQNKNRVGEKKTFSFVQETLKKGCGESRRLTLQVAK